MIDRSLRSGDCHSLSVYPFDRGFVFKCPYLRSVVDVQLVSAIGPPGSSPPYTAHSLAPFLF